ncbi:MAG: hypothetical protein LBL58_13955 [Tannerellaceae bacterium]|jgi:preprotein translocase subunit SecD|nr:hypothetical protein [Tannerellaceae bacterium]
MKKTIKLIEMKIILIFLTIFLLISCDSNKVAGWYNTIDGKEITGKPVLTMKDVVFATLDSCHMDSTDIIYELSGKFDENGTKKFAEYTKKNIGNMLAFYYQGKILSAPMINMKIESGNFSINSKDKMLLKVYEDLSTR